jgi:hypothetical protein
MFFLRLRREGSRRLKGSVSARRGDYRNMDVTRRPLVNEVGLQVQGGLNALFCLACGMLRSPLPN